MSKSTTNPLTEYRAMSTAELAKKIEADQLSLKQLRSQLSIGKLTRHHQIGEVRQRIARLKTVLQEKIMLELANQDGK
jgi:ribosomal protein L29